MELSIGSRWKSSVCSTEVIVVRAPEQPVELGCGGAPMTASDAPPLTGVTLAPELSTGSSIGKRYADVAHTLELLCVKAGNGTLTLDGAPLEAMAPKKLPSSD